MTKTIHVIRAVLFKFLVQAGVLSILTYGILIVAYKQPSVSLTAWIGIVFVAMFLTYVPLLWHLTRKLLRERSSHEPGE